MNWDDALIPTFVSCWFNSYIVPLTWNTIGTRKMYYAHACACILYMYLPIDVIKLIRKSRHYVYGTWQCKVVINMLYFAWEQRGSRNSISLTIYIRSILSRDVRIMSNNLGHYHSCRSPGPCFNIKTIFPRYGISMLKIRRSRDRLIFNTGVPILVRRYIYIETAPRPMASLIYRQLCHSLCKMWNPLTHFE